MAQWFARDPSPPLNVTMPRGWSMATGTGLVSTARDINRGWWPGSLSAFRNFASETLAMLRLAQAERDAIRRKQQG